MRHLVWCLALVACADSAAPPPVVSPEARLVEAVATVNRAAADVHRAGYRVLITVAVADSAPPKVGLLLFPR